MTTTPPAAEPAVDLLQRLSGCALDPDRLREIVAAYGPIFEEIARLRSLELRDVHPAVVYEPTAAYRRGR